MPRPQQQVKIVHTGKAGTYRAKTPRARVVGRAAREVGSVCYFIRIHDLVKIGTSTNLIKRIEDQGAKVTDILWVEPGGRERERELHKQFAAHCAKGEFFRPCPEINAYITSCRTAAGF